MTLEVLLFASYADALGTARIAIEVGGEATVRDLLRRVRELPGAQRLPERPMVAVNRRYARPDQRLRADDEVAIIPPVAGG